uniref:TSA: Wollemia nobilis Ref_Wollemi_Transcript_5321_2666 transcribed RNA sequence n=1 Tax=Wollemia nobilis TaxID=56998 RepID=A0A0C9S8A0_9CONI
MGKPGGKKKKTSSSGSRKIGVGFNGESDHAVFIKRALELKEEGNKQFQSKNYAEAMALYEKALKVLPGDHSERAFLHSNRAVCLMKMEPVDYEMVVDECTLALDVNPSYKKALMRRARAYEALGKIDMALEDVEVIVQAYPNDEDALETSKKLREMLETQTEGKNQGQSAGVAHKEKQAEAELEVESGQTRPLKLIYHDDIRLAEMPANCKLAELREIIRQRYPTSRAVLIKYKDSEGDLVTITNTAELRLAEKCGGSHESLRLYVFEVDPKQEPSFEDANEGKHKGKVIENGGGDGVELDKWVYDFAELFRTHLGIDPEAHVDLHTVGIEFCSEALEETATSEDAQRLFEMAGRNFQEIAAVALFNWGNVHMCTATKKIHLEENASKEEGMAQLQAAYDWARGEYIKAGEKYDEALRIKPDFYEGLLALAQQQYESAKLGWSLALASNLDLETWDPSETLNLFTNAEEKMQMGIETWEKLEEERINYLKKPFANKDLVKKSLIGNGFKENMLSADEAAEHATAMRSQINLFWGNMLFEHSHIEFKLGLPTWEEHLDIAVEKFKLGGASPTDVSVLLKNHSSNAIDQEGLGFEIDEIVQAWNEMCEAKRLVNKSTSFRLEPLFSRKVPRLHQILEHVQSVWH